MKYQKWIDRNTKSLIGKNIVVTGATGGIGLHITEVLCYLEANVIMAVRNEIKAKEVINKIKASNPKALISYYLLDVSSYESINSFVANIDDIKIDYFINNAGVYHLKQTLVNNHEIHYMTNFLGTNYLIDKILSKYSNDSDFKLISMGSISYKFSKINFKDHEGFKVKNKMFQYGRTKRFLTIRHFYLKRNNNVKMELVHPGISATNLFQAGCSKLFNKIMIPFMKLMFMNSAKASLGIIYAIFNDTKNNEWIGPRGFLKVWGYPKKYKVSNKVLNEELALKVENIYQDDIKGE